MQSKLTFFVESKKAKLVWCVRKIDGTIKSKGDVIHFLHQNPELKKKVIKAQHNLCSKHESGEYKCHQDCHDKECGCYLFNGFCSINKKRNKLVHYDFDHDDENDNDTLNCDQLVIDTDKYGKFFARDYFFL